MAETKNKNSVFGDKLTTPVGRLSFPHLLKPSTEGQYASGKYETGFLIPKSKDVKPMADAALTVARAAWPKKKFESLADLAFEPIRDGDQMADDGDGKKETFRGHWYIRAKTSRKPGLVDAAGNNLEDGEEVYGGQRARLSLAPFSYETAGKPGVTWMLRNVQIVGGGERFGGGGNPSDDFGALEDDGSGFDNNI